MVYGQIKFTRVIATLTGRVNYVLPEQIVACAEPSRASVPLTSRRRTTEPSEVHAPQPEAGLDLLQVSESASPYRDWISRTDIGGIPTVFQSLRIPQIWGKTKLSSTMPFLTGPAMPKAIERISRIAER